MNKELPTTEHEFSFKKLLVMIQLLAITSNSIAIWTQIASGKPSVFLILLDMFFVILMSILILNNFE